MPRCRPGVLRHGPSRPRVYGFELSTLRRQITGVTATGDLITGDGIVEIQMELRTIVAEWSRRVF